MFDLGPRPEADPLRFRFRSSHAATRIVLCLVLAGAVLSAAFPAAAQHEGAPAPLPPPAIPAPAIDRPDSLPPGVRVSAATVSWTDGPPHRFLWSPGKIWRIVPETGVIGWLDTAGHRRPIEQTRLRIEEEHAGKTRTLARLAHTANTDVSLLFPGDRRLQVVRAAENDSLRPWPNACILLPYDLDHSIDLNLNDRMELPISCSASLGEPAASRILFLEPDSLEKPRLVPPSEFISVVRFDEGVINAIRYPGGARDPVLEGQFLPLYRCRFLARLEIRGEEACRTCCLIQMVFRRDSTGVFRPVYDRATQSGLLNRLREDLSLVQTGGTGTLTPPEEAALARAASFFYLTGTGAGTRQQLLKALGPRAAIPQSMQLLARLDRFFLKDAK